MTAPLYEPYVRVPNAERADGGFRLWGSYDTPAAERARLEAAGTLEPRRMVAVGGMAPDDSAAFRGALVVVDESESVYIL